jgi:shikimate dehydrogenase
MWPKTAGTIWPHNARMPAHLAVFDLVYNPLETRLLHQARTAGALAIDGLGMLVYQGALAFTMWTGRDEELEAIGRMMRTACSEALAG